MLEKVQVKNVDQVVKELKAFEATSVRQLRSDLKLKMGPEAQAMAATIPKEPPLRAPQGRKKSQMAHRGRTRWRGVNKPVVEFRPGKSRRGGDSLVSLKFTGGSRGLGFDYAELAGIRRRPPAARSKPYQRRGSDKTVTHRLNGQGDAFITALAEQTNKGPGRFAFSAALKRRPQLIAMALSSMNNAADKVNRRFKTLGG